MLRAGAAAGLGEVRRATGTRWALEEFLAGVVENPQPPVVQIGVACAAHKWTLRITDCSGEIAAYIKWGSNSSAQKRLENEYKILSALPKGFGPRPMKFGPLSDGFGLCIEPLCGVPMSSNRGAWPLGTQWQKMLADFLERLCLHTPLPVDSHPAFSRLASNAPRPVLDWIDRLRARPWPVVIQHGDLAPWNLIRPSSASPHSNLMALDWEFGSLTGGAYFDAAYYALQIASLIDRLDPTSALQYAVGELTRNPWPLLTSSEAEAITALTAYESWQAALTDGDSPEEPQQKWQRAIWDRRPG